MNPDLVDTATDKINHLFSSKMVFPLLGSLEPMSKLKRTRIFKSRFENYNKIQTQSIICRTKTYS